MNGTNAVSVGAVGPFNPGPSWQIEGSSDFNGDNKSDILWQNSDGTPAEIIDKLNQETNAALADPKIRARMAESGGNALAGSPADFAKLIAEETEKWAKVIRAANIKAE